MLRALLPLALLGGALAASCRDIRSCSPESRTQKTVQVDPCCVPSPAGLFVFRQRFEPDVGGDMGSWGIDGMDILEWVSTMDFGTSRKD
jgi:ribonuclease T2